MYRGNNITKSAESGPTCDSSGDRPPQLTLAAQLCLLVLVLLLLLVLLVLLLVLVLLVLLVLLLVLLLEIVRKSYLRLHRWRKSNTGSRRRLAVPIPRPAAIRRAAALAGQRSRS